MEECPVVHLYYAIEQLYIQPLSLISFQHLAKTNQGYTMMLQMYTTQTNLHLMVSKIEPEHYFNGQGQYGKVKGNTWINYDNE